MITSRSLALTRLRSCALKNPVLQNVKVNVNKQIIRNHGEIFYRKRPVPRPVDIKRGVILGGIVWWWTIWHLLTDFGEVVGSPDMPDPESWTDEELGIPPDDED